MCSISRDAAISEDIRELPRRAALRNNHEPASGHLLPGHGTCHRPLYVLGKSALQLHHSGPKRRRVHHNTDRPSDVHGGPVRPEVARHRETVPAHAIDDALQVFRKLP